jgi:ClpP class serine protease
VSVADVKAGYGEGALVTGKQAKTHGMVDQVGTLEGAVNRARQLSRAQHAGIRAMNETYLLGL